MDNLNDRLLLLKGRINAAAERAGRSGDDIELMAVSKTRTRIEIDNAYSSGLRLFGENRVHEAADKFISPPSGIKLHLIGHLQTNKAKTAAGTFSCVESIDKVKTAAALDKYCVGMDKVMDILLELNTSGEDSKNGFDDNSALFYAIDEILMLKNLRIRGLMTIAPFTSDKGLVRGAFRLLYETGNEMNRRYPELSAGILSMGMSSDFETAIEEGSTRIRVGTTIFGERDYS